MVDTANTLRDEGGGSVADAPHELGPLLFRILCADDLSQPPARYPLSRFVRAAIGRASVSAAREDGATLRIALRDPFASSRHVRLEGSGKSWHLCDEGSTNGTLINGERVPVGEQAPLREGDLLEIGHTFFLFRASARGIPESDLRLDSVAADALTLNPEWQLELAKAERLARTSHEILIQGESGVGKELLACFLHEKSGRSGAMVSVNCAALPESLLEDELFGHVRGAFSGAEGDRQGLVRAAHQGTLFLDEIGDMPLGLQVKFLRVLEDHKVRPVGSERELLVDVRVLAATQPDLEEMVAQRKFRHDLFARLGLLPLRVPALRERKEDLGLLIRSLLRATPQGLERVRFTLDSLRLVLRYSWPLNVRELRHALLAAVDLAGAEGEGPAVICPHHLPQAVRELRPSMPSSAALPPKRSVRVTRRLERDLTEPERELRDRLLDRLRRLDGNVAAVAREMGKGRTQVQRWMARFGIGVEVVRTAKE